MVLVFHPSRPAGRHATSPAKASSVPGITHTASPGSSAAAKPRVPVPKSHVTSLPIEVERCRGVLRRAQRQQEDQLVNVPTTTAVDQRSAWFRAHTHTLV